LSIDEPQDGEELLDAEIDGQWADFDRSSHSRVLAEGGLQAVMDTFTLREYGRPAGA
jgi:hypothetical protein